ncbi:hypothetical protein N7478_002400 [Penicillium angulare]|uniref:uncharacterized protein n=1 Tax=Penicillium angulare TaxID=116970 RepID=UPI002540EF6C|nr:uncharacterized protein N7478_002400 [Penicillium angulare]KAJ5286714.1 hypothetical protein N7478_002400 [Penicillium angulare]
MVELRLLGGSSVPILTKNPNTVHGGLTMTSPSFENANSEFQVGINQGSIYLSQERSEPRFEPLSTVPFQRDPDFVCRDGPLNQIHQRASLPGARIVLVGLGGVGKTQLAIEYCHWVRQRSPETWVFWIHASNAARCEKSLRDLADRVEIPERDDRNANIFQLVGKWLQDKRIGKWILVLDNVDDDELIRKPLATGTESQSSSPINASTQPPLWYLLESSNGSIIIISRSKGVALNIASPKNLIEVQPMEKSEAMDLLQKKADIPAESEDIAPLVEALEFMPLAIVQAAAYITHRSPRCSVSQYLEKIQKSDREAAQLLNYAAGVLHRDWEAKNSILVTWQISFDYIHGLRPSATGLLSLMSFFDRQGIPESILRVRQSQETHRDISPGENEDSSGEEGEGSLSGSDTDQCFEDDISTLTDFALISIGEQSTVFIMHRLVQLTVRTWMKTNGQLEQGVWYAQEIGNITDATEMALKSRKQRLKFFGAENEKTLQSTAILAAAYSDEGLWKDAEQLEMLVMETRKTKLGEDHPDTLTSIANLALTYSAQGRWEEAEQLQVQDMETSKTKLGADHPDTLTSMANLALTYMEQGRVEDAEQLHMQVIETRKTKIGEDHPDTLCSMASLAFTCKSTGRKADAMNLLRICVAKQQLFIGPAHPDTVLNSNTLLEWETEELGTDSHFMKSTSVY